ncbi:putative glucose-6-phosphate 1-epimerase [Stegodyphus dumicola]|uniref:putative glucose-6-phosphate 1-epimerase n=1 Tax=Stegodyphus dumicola TaxID=202533 RepID=UPI0015B0FE40|nr:putative glucose-6-phosphate 1-epimerase [Stegodyphus dumicola]
MCRFRFEYTLSLISETQLKMDVVITNTGDSSFSFTFLLHTYFSVPDVTLCKVTGLKDCTYIDKVRNGKEFIEDREEVTVSEFTDRIYKNTSVVHKIKNLSGDREGSIEKFNLPDTVIWNPWIENAKSMTDFDDDEWKNMICVEAGYVSSSVALQSSKSFLASQILSVH